MYILGQSGANSLEVIGLDIISAIMQTPEGQQYQLFRIIGYGYGFNLLLATYETETEARTILQDIHGKMYQGEEFYDMQQEEAKLLGKRNG